MSDRRPVATILAESREAVEHFSALLDELTAQIDELETETKRRRQQSPSRKDGQ